MIYKYFQIVAAVIAGCTALAGIAYVIITAFSRKKWFSRYEMSRPGGLLLRNIYSTTFSDEKAAIPNQKENAVPDTALYMVVAGDNQTPCRFDGRQFVIDWIQTPGVPLYSFKEAHKLMDQSYRFLESTGRTAHPILRAVPVFIIQEL